MRVQVTSPTLTAVATLTALHAGLAAIDQPAPRTAPLVTHRGPAGRKRMA